MKQQLLDHTKSYLRHAVACTGAIYLSGITDPKVLANAFLAGLIGPLLKSLTPSKSANGDKVK